MLKSDFYYDLPQELIAQTPVYPRDASRLLYYNRSTKERRDLHFFDIENILQKGDLLVVNNTRVINARLYAYNDNGKKFEVFLLKRVDLKHWEALLKPAKKAKIGKNQSRKSGSQRNRKNRCVNKKRAEPFVKFDF